jgi:hypothetical protein
MMFCGQDLYPNLAGQARVRFVVRGEMHDAFRIITVLEDRAAGRSR